MVRSVSGGASSLVWAWVAHARTCVSVAAASEGLARRPTVQEGGDREEEMKRGEYEEEKRADRTFERMHESMNERTGA